MNCGIALRQLRVAVPELVEQLTSLVPARCPCADDLRLLHQTLLPTADEIRALQEAPLPPPAAPLLLRLHCSLARVPHVHMRVQMLLFNAEWRERADLVRSRADSLRRACEVIHSSQRLRRIMADTLAIGNALNEHAAEAFSLLSLSRLSATKGFDGETTVLDLLHRRLSACSPEALLLSEEEDAANIAVRLSPGKLRSELDTLRFTWEQGNTFLRDAHRRAKGENRPRLGGRTNRGGCALPVRAGGRSALLSAIRGRGGASGGGEAGRGALLASIRGRGAVNAPKSARGGGRGALLAAIRSRGSGDGQNEDNSPAAGMQAASCGGECHGEAEVDSQPFPALSESWRDIAEGLRLPAESICAAEAEFRHLLRICGESDQVTWDDLFTTLASFIRELHGREGVQKS